MASGKPPRHEGSIPVTVYVDDMRARFGRMIMCHMIAETDAELHAMADAIGVSRRWFQDPATMPKVSSPHYDIALSKRAAAVAAGAIEITARQCAALSFLRRTGHPMGDPVTAVERMLGAKRKSA